MRQRITFIHKPEDAVDPESIKVSTDSLRVIGLVAAREDRITLGFDELPEEIRLVLDQSHELHVRYIRKTHHAETAPFLAKLSPGLHVFFSPQRIEGNADLICPLLNEVFKPYNPARCESPEKSFTLLPTQRFQHSTTYEYYLPQSQISRHSFVDYFRPHCPPDHPSCHPRVIALQEADSIEIDFDAISHALSITALWHSQRWNLDLKSDGPQDRLEVGILSNEQPIHLEELSLAGFLTVVGEDTEPSPTLFSFPSRHHLSSSSFSSRFIQPTGLHPTLQLQISDSNPPPKHDTCSLHAYFTLPRAIFPDKYQLRDPMFMASKNLSTVRYVTSPVDLEAPEYAMSLWGSSLLLELAPPSPSAEPWTAEVPLHLRYLAPAAGGIDQTEVPWPVLFWACTAEEGSKFTINPFDRVNLGYDGLFGPRTMFYHLKPKPNPALLGRDGQLYSTIQVPVLDTSYTKYVEIGTAAVILLGFSWVMWTLYGAWRRQGYQKDGRSGNEAKKTQ